MRGALGGNVILGLGLGLVVLAVALVLAPAPAEGDLVPVSGRVAGTWRDWRRHGWVLATDGGPVRVRVGRDAWGGETELLAAGILDGDRIEARVGRDRRGRPDGDMWEIVDNGDTVLTWRERRARQERGTRTTAATLAGAGLVLAGWSAARRRLRPRREDPPAHPRRSD